LFAAESLDSSSLRKKCWVLKKKNKTLSIIARTRLKTRKWGKKYCGDLQLVESFITSHPKDALGGQ
jgi:hypothetical protein